MTNTAIDFHSRPRTTRIAYPNRAEQPRHTTLIDRQHGIIRMAEVRGVNRLVEEQCVSTRSTKRVPTPGEARSPGCGMVSR